MRRSAVLTIILAAAAFAGGWTAHGRLRVGSDFGALRRVPGECRSRGRTLRHLGAYPALNDLEQPSREGRQRKSVHFRQDEERADLWLMEAGLLDDEVGAESSHYTLTWSPRGWVVEDCEHGIRYHPGRP